jgi:hypothetical protein
MNRITEHFTEPTADSEALIRANGKLREQVETLRANIKVGRNYCAAIEQTAREWRAEARAWKRLFWSVSVAFGGLLLGFICLLFQVK